MEREEIIDRIKENYIIGCNKVNGRYNKDTAITYLAAAMDMITDKEISIQKLSETRDTDTEIWVNLKNQLFKDYYNVAIKEKFYDLNKTIGEKLVREGVNRKTFNVLQEAIESYINMLTILEDKFNACL